MYVCVAETLKLELDMIRNTAPFNATGHPALSVNAGFSEGLPCGMMIVGRMFDDLTVLQVARAFEKIRDGANWCFTTIMLIISLHSA